VKYPFVFQTKRAKLQVLRAFYQQVTSMKSFVKKELVVYRTLNMFKQSPQAAVLVADCWIPEYAADIVDKALKAGNSNTLNSSADDEMVAFMEALPNDGKKQPTFIRTNLFTAPFQGIVNTYGTPRYREINPGFFALAMFPFLFGIMFGDMVHGALLLMFALYLIVFENSLANHDMGEMFQMVYGARYLLVMMGICALYMGFIYNEALSVAVSLFGESAYESGELFPNKPYIFGVDPVWRHSHNLIQYTNSLKMKMSIIVGVAQMMFGIVLKLLNNLHFGRYVEAVVESLPEILFMGLTFGYMSGLIFLKWSIDYVPEPPPCFSSGCDGVIINGYPLKAAPPPIIQIMIFMFKMQPLPPEYALYPGQGEFQSFILTIAVCSLPVLLFGKPLHLKRQMDMEHAAASEDTAGYSAVTDSESDAKKHTDDDDEHGHNFGDIMVHQGIHTVEFALGCVSNTASYLRLWALSLAHSQLSEVFWEYILVGYEFSLFGQYPGIAGGWKTLIPCYFIFFCCTIGILMMMESLSAFLHALRLQWVEFQSKFYDADGCMFRPLSFEDMDDAE
jgi:V-type H+-transporting ATPase subunit a